jgi:hypothetical protein
MKRSGSRFRGGARRACRRRRTRQHAVEDKEDEAVKVVALSPGCTTSSSTCYSTSTITTVHLVTSNSLFFSLLPTPSSSMIESKPHRPSACDPLEPIFALHAFCSLHSSSSPTSRMRHSSTRSRAWTQYEPYRISQNRSPSLCGLVRAQRSAHSLRLASARVARGYIRLCRTRHRD